MVGVYVRGKKGVYRGHSKKGIYIYIGAMESHRSSIEAATTAITKHAANTAAGTENIVAVLTGSYTHPRKTRKSG